MSYIERKRYVIYITTAFLTGVVLYGFLGLLLFNDRDIIEQSSLVQRILIVIASGLVGGYLISSILTGGLLFVHYMKRKSVRFKVLAIVFFMITIVIIEFAGFFLNLPVYIYNLVQIVRRRYIVEK